MYLSDPSVGIALTWFCGYLLFLVFLRAHRADRWRMAIVATVATFLSPFALILLSALTCNQPGCGIVAIAAIPYTFILLPILAGIAFVVFDTRPDRWKG
jgi:hypothetical protein